MSTTVARHRLSGLVIALLLGLAGPLGCSNTSTDDSQPLSSNESSPPPAEESGPPPVAKPLKTVKLTPEQFAAEWEADNDGTATKYADGLLEISGTLEKFSVDLNGNSVTMIPCGSGEERKPVLHVVSTDREPWARVGLGQQVTVRGKLKNWPVGYPYLYDAVFVDPGPNTSIAIKATDLAAEAAPDARMTQKKYEGKGLIVEGKVVRIDKDGRVVLLDGGEPGLIECETVAVIGRPALGAALQVGQEVRLFCLTRVQVLLAEDVAFRLKECLPIQGQ